MVDWESDIHSWFFDDVLRNKLVTIITREVMTMMHLQNINDS